MRVLIPLLAVLVVLAGAANAGAAERSVPRGWLGVTADGPFDAGDAGEWDRMVAAGVESVRTAFYWSRLQPAEGVTDFASTDALVGAAAQRGLALLPVVQWPPDWAAADPGAFGSPPRDPADVQQVFTALVDRYGPNGSFWAERPDLPRRPVRTWQVFNEPNLEGFWSIQPFERRYTAALRAAAGGIRAADPAAVIVLAGMPGETWKVLAALYAKGARGSFDAVAIHPYTARPADVLRIIRYTRRVMRRNRDGRVPIWVTEFSWPAAAGRVPEPPAWASLSEAGQARRLRGVMRRLVAARVRLRIERVFWYSWLTAEVGQSAFDWSGLRRIRDGARIDTATLRVFRRWARRLEGCEKPPGDAVRCV